MKTCYIDGGSGVAGDMLLGGWIGLGLPVAELERTLKKVTGRQDWRLKVYPIERKRWPCYAVEVVGDRPFGGPSQMKRAVKKSHLPAPVKFQARQIIEALAWAETQAHGHGPAVFDPRGIGLLDTMVDVVGSVWAIWKLGIQRLSASSLNVGRIAPAAAHLIRRYRIPVYGEDFRHELATPTGVAILAITVSHFGPMPTVTLAKTGYGGGLRETPERPNVLGIYQYNENFISGTTERVIQLETLIDDMDPRLYPYISELAFREKALDVWWTPVGMKKGRPGLAFKILCHPQNEQALLEMLFRETTTLGVRRLPMERQVLKRYAGGLHKRAMLPAGAHKSNTEFEIAKKIALRRKVPLRTIL